MSRLCLSLVFALAIAAGSAAVAQVDPAADGIGIYADRAATVNTVTALPDEPFEVYLVATRLSCPGSLLGWEARIVVPDNASVWGWNIPGSGWLNIGSPPEFAVAYPTAPQLRAATQVLMTFIVRVTDASPAQFYVTHLSRLASNPNLPCYVDSSNLNIIRPLHPYPAGADHPSFAVNGALVAIEPGTWSQVKALYR